VDNAKLLTLSRRVRHHPPMADDDALAHELQDFRIGRLPDGSIVLQVFFATSAQALAEGRLASIALGMTRARADALARGLLAAPDAPAAKAH
jgi:hypothetical protein